MRSPPRWIGLCTVGIRGEGAGTPAKSLLRHCHRCRRVRFYPRVHGGRLQAARNDSEGSKLRRSGRGALTGIEAYTVPKPDLVQDVLRIARTTAGHLGLSASDINESDFVVDRPCLPRGGPSDRKFYERGRCNRGRSVGAGVYRQSHGWGVDYGQKLRAVPAQKRTLLPYGGPGLSQYLPIRYLK